MNDPLLATITAFQRALADYDKNAPSNDVITGGAYAKATYEPWQEVLENWSLPATTLAGAAAAVRLANQENDQFERSRVSIAMVKAAAAYFDTAENDPLLVADQGTTRATSACARSHEGAAR